MGQRTANGDDLRRRELRAGKSAAKGSKPPPEPDLVLGRILGPLGHPDSTTRGGNLQLSAQKRSAGLCCRRWGRWRDAGLSPLFPAHGQPWVFLISAL